MKTRYQTAFVLFALGYLFTCNLKENPVQESYVDSDEMLITVTDAQAETMGLEFGKLKKLLLSRSVISSGYLDTPPEFKEKISSIVSGKVVKVNYLIGDFVKKGNEIIRLESIEFLEIQKNYISVKSDLKFFEDNYLRQKKLSEENVSAKKVFYQSERDYFSAKAEFEYISKKLDILHASKTEIENGNITPYLSIRSTINGYVTDIHAVLGEFVDAEDVMVKVINPEHLHAELNVFEKDVLKIKIGQKVEVSTKTDNLSIMGEIFLIGKELDENSRSVPVHVHIQENENLLPGMFIEGKILLDEKQVLAIPEEGILREEGRSFVYFLMDNSNNEYTLNRKAVIPGEEKNGMVAIKFSEVADTSKLIAIKGVYYLSSGIN